MLNLQPETVWHYFEEISGIPRCSGNEEGIREYILTRGKEAGLEAEVDDTGNVLLMDGASAVPGFVLQSHMDMVCEKNSDVEHDFASDPIRPKAKNGWVTAEGTTLGADNGIGVAIALAVATGDFDFGPMDYLFTVDEERGLNGAANLEPDFLRADRLINLDSEEFGVFTIGCAGGGKTKINLPVDRREEDKGSLLEVRISGLVGGHSGGDIDKGRANAIKLLGRLLASSLAGCSPRLIELQGGDKHNAIPREARALLYTEESYESYEEDLSEYFSVLAGEYEETEPEMELDLNLISGSGRGQSVDPESTRNVLNLIRALPHGVMRYDTSLESTVETSTNLASVNLEGDDFGVLMSSRSSRGSRLESLRKRIEIIAGAFGGEVEHNEAYPAWQPNRETELLREAKKVFEGLSGEIPEVKVTHGGLETGIIGEKAENVEMISIGPTVESPHSPDERVNIDSVAKFWDFLLKLLVQLS